jgi:hypothetical protein
MFLKLYIQVSTFVNRLLTNNGFKQRHLLSPDKTLKIIGTYRNRETPPPHTSTFYKAVGKQIQQICTENGSFTADSNTVLRFSVADPDPGSGAFLTHGSGIRNGFFSL